MRIECAEWIYRTINYISAKAFICDWDEIFIWFYSPVFVGNSSTPYSAQTWVTIDRRADTTPGSPITWIAESRIGQLNLIQRS